MTFVILYCQEDYHYLEDCIKSLPKGFKTIICATKSVDGIPSSVKELDEYYIESSSINGDFTHAVMNYRGDFDFSKARNLAKSLTDDEWIFSLDADERLSHSQHSELIQLSRQLETETPEVMGCYVYNYSFFAHQTHNGDQLVALVKQCRIFRNSLKWINAAHEMIDRPIFEAKGEILISSILIIHEGYKQPLEVFAEKLKRNILKYAKYVNDEYYFERLLWEAHTLKELTERINNAK